MGSLQHRADALFTLTRIPRRVAVAGDPPGWRDDLEERGIEVVAPADLADVLVTTDPATAERAARQIRDVIVDGDRAASSALGGRAVTRLLTLPVSGTPIAILDLAQRRAAAYGVQHALVHAEAWRAVRNKVAARLVRHGLLPTPKTLITVGGEAGSPALVAAACKELGLEQRDWLMFVSLGAIVRRNAFLLFPQGSDEPAEALKFARVPGYSSQFDRDEAAAKLVAATGGAVAAHAPRHLGRFELDGYHASLETPARGQKLAAFLRQPISRRRKLEVLDRVADWLIQVARETAAPVEALAEERERFERQVLPFWADCGVDPDLARLLPPIPPTFQHWDVAEENIIVSGDGFVVVDWEFAQRHGLPLADLMFFAVHVLRILDGQLTLEERDRHFVDVLTGRAPSSPILFGWVRRLVEALNLPAESVATLATLNWLDRGKLSKEEHIRADTLGGVALADSFAERASVVWLEHPELGMNWNAWRA
ncbi:MAG TPA: hypothetical protein VIL91_08780 [Gaiellaceae bacterium]